MEENNQNPNAHPVQASPTEQISTPSPTKPGLKLPVLVSVIIFLIIIGSASAGYLFLNNSNKQKMCTTEAKICPDGSSVGRTGTKCEFAACPSASKNSIKTYTNQALGFEFNYPNNLFFDVIEKPEYLSPGEIVRINITEDDCKNYQGAYCGFTNSMYIEVTKSEDGLQAWLNKNVLTEETISDIPQGKYCYEEDRAKKENLSIAGVDAISYTWNLSQMGHPSKCILGKNYNENDPEKLQEIYFENDGYIYRLDRRFKKVSELEKSFDQILWTFKFTDDGAIDGSILSIPELGIKLSLDQNLKDLVYVVKDRGVQFSTKSLIELDRKSSTPPALYPGKYYCGADEAAIGAITKSSVKTDFERKLVGNFYVGYQGPQAACSNSAEVNNLQSSQSQLLKKALETAQSI